MACIGMGYNVKFSCDRIFYKNNLIGQHDLSGMIHYQNYIWLLIFLKFFDHRLSVVGVNLAQISNFQQNQKKN
jgi:hypothetical protein